MPRLEVSFGQDGPIVDVRLSVAAEDEAELVGAGRAVPGPLCVSGLVDTGAETTAIQQALAHLMTIPVFGTAEVASSALGRGTRVVPTYRIRMAFGPFGTPGPPRWRTITAAGMDIISPGAIVLIGRDLLATCRFTYDGRKHRFMMSY
jgi:hypothetical protein